MVKMNISFPFVKSYIKLTTYTIPDLIKVNV